MTTLKKVFFGKAIYIVLIEFLLLVFLIAKYHLFNELDVNNGQWLFNILQVALTLTGAIIAIIRMRDWGGYKSKLGKVLLCFSIGLFAWTIGSMIWFYYNIFLGIAVPYPSLADLAYVFINPSFIIGMAIFGHTITLKETKEKLKEKIYYFFVPISMALLTFYTIFILNNTHETSNILHQVLNFYYAGGNIVQLVVIMLICGVNYNYLGIRLRLPFILVLLAAMISYTADNLYAYTTAAGIYANGGITDLLYVLLLTFMALAIHTLHPRLLKDKIDEIE